MRDLSQNQKDRIVAASTRLTEALKVMLADGSVMGFTKFPISLTRDGVLYKARPGMNISNIATASGLNVDNATITAFFVEGVITEDDIYARDFDNSTYDRVVIDYEDETFEPVSFQDGVVGEFLIQDGAFQVELRTEEQKLQQRSGRLTSPTCRVDVFGNAQCNSAGRTNVETGVTPATYVLPGVPFKVQSATIASVTGIMSFTITMATSYPNGFFTDGVVKWLSGPNIGKEMEILSYTLSGGIGTFTLFEPMGRNVTVGDTVSLVVGCNRKFQTCKTLFDNVISMRAEIYMITENQLYSISGQ